MVVMVIVVMVVMVVVVESLTWNLQPSCFSSSSAPLPLENCDVTSISFPKSGMGPFFGPSPYQPS